MCGVPVRALRGLSASPDQRRPQGRGVRADREPGRRPRSRQQERSGPRRGAAGDAGHPDSEDTLLDARTNSYLLAIARARGSSGGDRVGLSWIDISTSEFMVTECATAELAATLARINPNEVIVTDALDGDPGFGATAAKPPSVTPLTRDVFDWRHRRAAAVRLFQALATMDGLAAMSRLEVTGSSRRRHLYRPHPGRKTSATPSPPSREAAGTTTAIDPAPPAPS